MRKVIFMLLIVLCMLCSGCSEKGFNSREYGFSFTYPARYELEYVNNGFGSFRCPQKGLIQFFVSQSNSAVPEQCVTDENILRDLMSGLRTYVANNAGEYRMNEYRISFGKIKSGHKTIVMTGSGYAGGSIPIYAKFILYSVHHRTYAFFYVGRTREELNSLKTSWDSIECLLDN